MVYRVIVIGFRGEKMEIDLCDTEEQFKTITVLQLKEKIPKPEGCPPDTVQLVFTDKLLEGDSTLLCDYGIQHMSAIHMATREPGEEGLVPEKGDGGMGDKDKNRIFRYIQEDVRDIPVTTMERRVEYMAQQLHCPVMGLAEGFGGMGDKDKNRSKEKLSDF